MVLLEATKLAISSAEIMYSSAIGTWNRATLSVWTTKHYNSQPADLEDTVNDPNHSYQPHESTVEPVNAVSEGIRK